MERTSPLSDSVESDIPTASETERTGVPRPKGHKRRRVADGVNDSISALKKHLTEIIDTKFQRLDERFQEMCKTIEFMSEKYNEIKKEVSIMVQERDEDRKYIKELENNLEISERLAKASSIELRNVPNSATENKAELLKIAANLATSLELDLKKSEIDDIYRINPKQVKNSVVLIRFTSVIRKEEVVRSVKKYNNEHSTKLTSQQLGMGPPTVPIYVSEHLTTKTRKLFFLAREFAKANNFRFCWCSHGRIFLRKKEGAPHMLIQDEYRLDELKKGLAPQ